MATPLRSVNMEVKHPCASDQVGCCALASEVSKANIHLLLAFPALPSMSTSRRSRSFVRMHDVDFLRMMVELKLRDSFAVEQLRFGASARGQSIVRRP